MHFVGPDQLHGFEERLTTDVYPAGFDWTPDWRLPVTERLRLVPQHDQPARLPRVAEAAMQTDYDDEVCFRAVAEDPRPLAARRRAPVLPDRLVHEPARPVGGAAPPLGPLRRARDRACPRSAPIPRAEADPHSLRLRDMIGLDDRPLTDAEVRHARRGYYAAISYLDERVGEVLEALAAHRARRRHGRRLHRRPRRDARRAWALVQDVVPRRLRARAADRARPGPRRPRRVRRARLAARPRPHAGRAGRAGAGDADFEGASLAERAHRGRRGRPARRSASTWPRACTRPR